MKFVPNFVIVCMILCDENCEEEFRDGNGSDEKYDRG